MADTQQRDIGLTLQRMGAGFAGNLAQFDATRAAQQETDIRRQEERARRARELSQERQVALAQDAQAVGQFLEMGETGRAIELLDNRLQMIGQLGGDPSDTQEIRNMIASGDVDGAAREVKLFTTEAITRGLIKPLVSVDEQIKKDQLDLDKAEFQAKYGTTPDKIGSAGGSGGVEGQKLKLEQQRAAREAAQFAAEQADIPERWQKPYLDATDAETKAVSVASEIGQLAADFEAIEELPAGARATFNEAAKKMFGEQDAVTELRQRFNATKNAQVMANLPPGVASDKDIEIAMSGFPVENASRQNIVGFLRGQQKVQALEAAYQRFKVDYLDQNRTLKGVNQAWRKEATRVFNDIKAEISKPINRSYTIDDYEAEARRRGLVK